MATTETVTTVAKAHITNPCAVSRKKTSWVWRLAHFVRSRPVMNPPSPDATHCMTMSHTAVMTENVAADAPELGHAEIDANPSPVPNAASNNDTAAAVIAPAKIAAQDTAETGDVSAGTPIVPTVKAGLAAMCAALNARSARAG